MGGDDLFKKKKALSRKVNTRSPRKILIVCEGEKTETNYFKAFPANPEIYDSVDVVGEGYNTVSLINSAIKLKDKAEKQKTPYIEVWCVFDKDSFSTENFNNALELARKNDIKCAYSIEAFEIWYVLHFNFCDTGICRTQYEHMLKKLLKEPYKKNDPDMYKKLKKNQKTAIQNAKNLYTRQKDNHISTQNPITTVYKLVERLNQ